MVVSVDITGVLEERLRRLVELGLYASVAEAVREGVRRLLSTIDLKEIALKLYIEKNVTLNYICEFSSTSCTEIIDYLLEKEVLPLLGSTEVKDKPIIREQDNIIIDPSALYVLYNSRLSGFVSMLRELGYVILVPRSLKSYLEVLEAKALFTKNVRSPMTISLSTECGKANIQEKGIIISSLERDTLVHAKSCGYTLITEDIRLRQFAEKINLSVYSWLDFVYFYKEKMEKTYIEELLLSLKAIPVILPYKLESLLLTNQY
ncbi:MAG: type II toxin-antitoxin system ParD family antitoxin [Desulfurococcales archaeon]|nr:type II toxin-antitoxin system ParD family antitoxin [Desulfurococcales archaeon]MEB3788938.1 type II toxin-antitoxin system ParD family antitoxin [Desulfurococcales archaeon]